jgi:EAL domain-containing protein (putative c-di-GMP-specific phosphodiesterase class I)
LLHQLITIGKTLHAKVVAEGVETKSQADKIIACGAHFGQGYYCYPPLSVPEILQLT